MHRGRLRRWARLVPTLVGLTSLACCGASAQRNPLADLAPAPPPPLDLPVARLTATDPPEIAAPDETLPDAPVPNLPVADPEANDSNASDTPQEGQKPTSPGFPPISPIPRPLPPAPGEHP